MAASPEKKPLARLLAAHALTLTTEQQQSTFAAVCTAVTLQFTSSSPVISNPFILRDVQAASTRAKPPQTT